MNTAIFEKIKRYGVKALTQSELLTATSLENGDIYNRLMTSIDVDEFQTFDLNYSKDKKLLVYMCFSEIIRRRKACTDRKIRCTSDAVPYFLEYADMNKEYFIVLTLNGANELIKKHVITIGLANKTQIHPREIFSEAIADRACFIIAGHNHPSGSLEPSVEDLAVTEKIKVTGDIIGIKVLDHIIFSKKGHFSIFHLDSLEGTKKKYYES